MNDPILITGCARSGTSMIGGIVHMCGAWGGEMSGPTKYNKKGMFENRIIRNVLIKTYLKESGLDRMGQLPLPDINNLKPFSDLKDRITYVIKKQQYEDGPWFYKGAKMCLLWPIWNEAFPNAKWVIVRRSDKGIIDSCLRTGFMRAYKDTEGWQIWLDEHLKRFKEMRKAGLDIIEIWPEWIIEEGNYRYIKRMIKYLGLKWKDKIIKDFVTPDLWHGNK